MSDKSQFEPIAQGEPVTPSVNDVPASYAGNVPEDPDPAAPHSPNSFYLPLGRRLKPGSARRGYISWQSDNPVAVLSLVLFVIDLLAIVLLSFIAVFVSEHNAIDEAVKVLGQIALTIVGATVGATVAGSGNRK